MHALYYPPTNGDFTAPAGEKPPLIVQAHGGPTGKASSSFSLANQYWTSRGFALVDVDYGGSSGYGRAYRQRLNGEWGIVDVEDVIAAVALPGRARAGSTRKRVAIHGGSAGGFTVLAALAQSDVFGAGAELLRRRRPGRAGPRHPQVREPLSRQPDRPLAGGQGGLRRPLAAQPPGRLHSAADHLPGLGGPDRAAQPGAHDPRRAAASGSSRSPTWSSPARATASAAPRP